VSLPPNGILIGSSIFTRLVVVVKRIPSELLLLLENWFRIVTSQRSTATTGIRVSSYCCSRQGDAATTGIRVSSSIQVGIGCSSRGDVATTGISVSTSIDALLVETRLLPAFGSLVKVAAVVEMWLLPVFGSLIL